MSLFVIKYGGHAMDSAELALSFAMSIKKLTDLGHKIVLTHGGGPHINALLKRLDIKSVFQKGLRVTDDATMESVEMVLAGTLNSQLVTLFQEAGLKSVGLSGKSDSMLEAIQKADYGLVGDVIQVNTDLLYLLLNNNYLPIVSPIGYGHKGKSLNINADTASGAIAGALKADAFVLVTDVAGVLDENSNLFKELTFDKIKDLKDNEVINGGMIPKVDSCIYAIEKGCTQAYIVDGRVDKSLEKLLCNNEDLGTLIKK